MAEEASGLVELIVGVGGAVIAVLTYYWNIYRTQLELYGECIRVKNKARACYNGLTNVEEIKFLICLDCSDIEDEIRTSRNNVGFAIAFAITLFTMGILTDDYLTAAFYAFLSLAFMLAILWNSSSSLVYYRETLSAALAVLDQCEKQSIRQQEGQ